MLTDLKTVLADARQRRYAVPMFDCIEDIMVRTILETAERHRSPVILAGLEQDLEGNGWNYVSGLVRAVADRHNVPVVLHLDHATNLDMIRRAVDLRFTSVMIDGSSLPFAENVALTRAAVQIAQPHGISVEGELGCVGGSDLAETCTSETVLTDPEEVAKFVEQTGVDALAVSIGTQHGVYRSLPNLDIECLKKLHAASPVPLVLHGGSGTPADQVRVAVCNGICKMNIYADCRIAMTRGFKQAAAALKRADALPRELFAPIGKELAAAVLEKMELLGSVGKA